MANDARTHFLFWMLLGATLLIGAASVYLHYLFFPPHFSGWGEVTQSRTVSGWAINRNEPHRRVEIQLYIDNGFAAYDVAQLPRPDVVKAGWTQDERCGYSFPIPLLAPGEHEARVYAVHKLDGGAYLTMQAIGNPLRFHVDTNGTVRPSN